MANNFDWSKYFEDAQFKILAYWKKLSLVTLPAEGDEEKLETVSNIIARIGELAKDPSPMKDTAYAQLVWDNIEDLKNRPEKLNPADLYNIEVVLCK